MKRRVFFVYFRGGGELGVSSDGVWMCQGKGIVRVGVMIESKVSSSSSIFPWSLSLSPTGLWD